MKPAPLAADETTMMVIEWETQPVRERTGFEGRRALCPVCDSTAVFVAKWRSLRERLLRGKGLRPYHCGECGTRYLDRPGLRSYGRHLLNA